MIARLPEPVRILMADRAELIDGCECTGQCRRQNNHWNGREVVSECFVDPCFMGEFTPGDSHLMAAPADPSIPLERAATVPVDELMVWCRSCREGAELDAAQGVLDLGGAA